MEKRATRAHNKNFEQQGLSKFKRNEQQGLIDIKQYKQEQQGLNNDNNFEQQGLKNKMKQFRNKESTVNMNKL